jgi:outer membrane protein OmpA-like peptidoglycan-associated protein
MSSEQDEGQSIGLLAAMMVIGLVVVGLLVGLAVRPSGGLRTTPPPPDSAEQALMIDAPLAGELTGTVYFAVDSAALDAHAQAELASVARVLLAAPAATVMLSGFHDSSGDTQHNARLALQRAQGVRVALLGLGIDERQLALRKPALTATGEPAALARRVDIRRLD